MPRVQGRGNGHSAILHMHVSWVCQLSLNLRRCASYRWIGGAEGFETRNGQKEAAFDVPFKGRTMNRTLTILAVGAALFAGLAAPAQAASEVSLARFDCGTPPAPTAVN